MGQFDNSFEIQVHWDIQFRDKKFFSNNYRPGDFVRIRSRDFEEGYFLWGICTGAGSVFLKWGSSSCLWFVGDWGGVSFSGIKDSSIFKG